MRIHRIGQKREVRVKRFIVKVSNGISILLRASSVHCPRILNSEILRCLHFRILLRSGCNRSKCASRGWFLGRSLMRKFVALALSISRCCLNDHYHEVMNSRMCITDVMSLDTLVVSSMLRACLVGVLSRSIIFDGDGVGGTLAHPILCISPHASMYIM